LGCSSSRGTDIFSGSIVPVNSLLPLKPTPLSRDRDIPWDETISAFFVPTSFLWCRLDPVFSPVCVWLLRHRLIPPFSKKLSPGRTPIETNLGASCQRGIICPIRPFPEAFLTETSRPGLPPLFPVPLGDCCFNSEGREH